MPRTKCGADLAQDWRGLEQIPFSKFLDPVWGKSGVRFFGG